MKYDRFEQLPVWQAAIELGQKVYSLTKHKTFRRQRSLRDQIEGAAVPVSNNIAEGFERGTTQELLTLLYIARGSAGEVRSTLCLVDGIPEFADLKSEILSLKSQAESISRLHASFAAGPIPCKTRESRASATSMTRPASAKKLCATARRSWKNSTRFVRRPRARQPSLISSRQARPFLKFQL
jgi:four helix bundle protein